MPGDARGSVCVAAICRYTSLVCSVVQEYGAAARHHHSKWRHDSAPMNQNSTAAHRPVVLMTTAPDTALWPPDYPDRDSDRDATSHPAMKIRHLNPRQMISIPEQRVTVRHPVLKAPPGKMRHTAEFMNLTPADQPPRQIALHLQPPVSLTQRGRPPGWLWTSATISPCISARSQSSGDIRKYASGSPEIFTQGKYLSPSAFSPRSHTTPLAHIAGRAPESLILSVCHGITAKVFVNGKEAAKVADVIAELTTAQAFAAFILRDIGRWLVIFIRDSRTAITALVTAIGPVQVLASMIRPGKTAPSVSVGVDSTKEALTALSSLHCSMRQRLITSCSGSA